MRLSEENTTVSRRVTRESAQESMALRQNNYHHDKDLRGVTIAVNTVPPERLSAGKSLRVF